MSRTKQITQIIPPQPQPGLHEHFRFEIVHQSKKSRARVTKIHTPHGVIETPAFVAVGTNAALKAVDSVALNGLGVQLMFCNTYHLMLQPGADLVAAAGGLHSFMNHNGPLITDSGGFQVFSLAYGSVHDELKSKGQKRNEGCVTKISEEGVVFRSYRDGTKMLLTPETSIAAQKKLGADIIVSFDELPPYHISQQKLKKSLERTHRWEERSLIAHKKDLRQQALYGIIHGGIDSVMRRQSAEHLSKFPFDGFAIGGSVGKNRQEMLNMLGLLMPHVPEDKPNHLLGIGDIESISGIVPLGIDTFDSSHPTRCARHGLLMTKKGNIRIAKADNATMFKPIDDDCTCATCKNYTRAYLHHLFKAHELAAFTLASVHNLHFMSELMASYRRMILEDRI